VLKKKNNVKNDGDVAKTEFHRITRYPRPILLHGRIDDQLGQGQPAAGEVEQNGVDAPPNGRLALVINPRLRDVFEKNSGELDVSESINLQVG
jgi:hypothetical protein